MEYLTILSAGEIIKCSNCKGRCASSKRSARLMQIAKVTKSFYAISLDSSEVHHFTMRNAP